MNISFTTLEDAWGDDYRKITKPKKQSKSNVKKDKHNDVLSVEIHDHNLINYFNKFSDDYKNSYITEILHNHVNKSSISTNNTRKNDVLFYLIGLLLIILLIDRIMD